MKVFVLKIKLYQVFKNLSCTLGQGLELHSMCFMSVIFENQFKARKKTWLPPGLLCSFFKQ